MRWIPYDRGAAVRYAHRWSYDRNPHFYDYELIGGDCTNFASQCLFAGTGVMNFTPTFGWYYRNANDKSPSWTGVEYFYNYLTEKTRRIGPFAINCGIDRIEPGDFVQLGMDAEGRFSHTPVVVERGEVPSLENILVAAHSADADFRPLSTYPFRMIRFLHVQGAWRPPQPHGPASVS